MDVNPPELRPSFSRGEIDENVNGITSAPVVYSEGPYLDAHSLARFENLKLTDNNTLDLPDCPTQTEIDGEYMVARQLGWKAQNDATETHPIEVDCFRRFFESELSTSSCTPVYKPGTKVDSYTPGSQADSDRPGGGTVRAYVPGGYFSQPSEIELARRAGLALHRQDRKVDRLNKRVRMATAQEAESDEARGTPRGRRLRRRKRRAGAAQKTTEDTAMPGLGIGRGYSAKDKVSSNNTKAASRQSTTQLLPPCNASSATNVETHIKNLRHALHDQETQLLRLKTLQIQGSMKNTDPNFMARKIQKAEWLYVQMQVRLGRTEGTMGREEAKALLTRSKVKKENLR